MLQTKAQVVLGRSMFGAKILQEKLTKSSRRLFTAGE